MNRIGTTGIQMLRECLGSRTLTDFAAQLGIARSTLSMIFLGKSQPGRKVMSRLARLYPERRDEITAFLLRLNGQNSHLEDIPVTNEQEPAA